MSCERLWTTYELFRLQFSLPAFRSIFFKYCFEMSERSGLNAEPDAKQERIDPNLNHASYIILSKGVPEYSPLACATPQFSLLSSLHFLHTRDSREVSDVLLPKQNKTVLLEFLQARNGYCMESCGLSSREPRWPSNIMMRFTGKIRFRENHLSVFRWKIFLMDIA